MAPSADWVTKEEEEHFAIPKSMAPSLPFFTIGPKDAGRDASAHLGVEWYKELVGNKGAKGSEEEVLAFPTLDPPGWGGREIKQTSKEESSTSETGFSDAASQEQSLSLEDVFKLSIEEIDVSEAAESAPEGREGSEKNLEAEAPSEAPGEQSQRDDDDIDMILNAEESDESKAEADEKVNKNVFTYARVERAQNPERLFEESTGGKPALKFDYQLDDFQLEAMARMEQGESVFVAAHTSAGKTAVAEYALALCKEHCGKAFYTSPIKTLSNQKYRDLKDAGFDVGLLTGDTQVRPEADAVVMTTEILRSMLYRGADALKDVEWVIFDEVHYVNDQDRGVVWEEALILLPHRINVLMLSATVPNVDEFAEWVGRTRDSPIRVVQTKKRPIPLEHKILYEHDLVSVTQDGKFNASGWASVKKRVKEDVSKGKRALHKGSQWKHLVTQLEKSELLPALIFMFSKAKADQAANTFRNSALIGKNERAHVEQVWSRALSRLRKKDKELPQVKFVKELTQAGVGIHHAGLLPIVKEAVELLFCRGCVRALFCTETFALGVNAPARAVAFPSLRKFDGSSTRLLHPGEYTQMAGRAGRRGLDEQGTVVVAPAAPRDLENLQENDISNLVKGSSSYLSSKFRLSYGTVLSVLRAQELTPEGLMRSSFQEFHSQMDAASRMAELRVHKRRQRLLEQLKRSESEHHPDGYETASNRLYLSREAAELSGRVLSRAVVAQRGKAVFCPGRLVYLSVGHALRPQCALACLISVFRNPNGADKSPVFVVCLPWHGDLPAPSHPQPTSAAGGADKVVLIGKRDAGMEEQDEYSVSVGSNKKVRKGKAYSEDAADSEVLKDGLPGGLPKGGDGYAIIGAMPHEVMALCKGKMTKRIQPQAILREDKGEIGSVVEFIEQCRNQPEKLEPINLQDELKMQTQEEGEDLTQLANVSSKLMHLPHSPQGEDREQKWARLEAVLERQKEKVNRLEESLSGANLESMPDFENRSRVLRRVGAVSSQGESVLLKGRVACELTAFSCELLGAEVILSGILSSLDPPELAAVLSAFVCQERRLGWPELPEEYSQLKWGLQKCYDTALELGEIQRDEDMDVAADDYAQETLLPGMAEVVLLWARGWEFSDITGYCESPEGSIVRCIVRLDEALRCVRGAARVMGDPKLFQKTLDASERIRRDVVFAPSLYVTG